MSMLTSSHYVIKTDRLFTPDELRGTFWVEIEAGRIRHILTEQPSGIEVLDTTGFLVAPGFIDVHIHGYGGHDIMEASSEALECMAKGLPHAGVTSFLPTTVGTRIAILQHVMAALSPKLATVEGARPLAWHLEGPFLNQKMPGAMNPENFEIPTIANAKALVDSGPVTLMAVAPEREGAIPVIEYLVSRGVHVSIGHTDTDFEHAVAGIAAGATSMNHLFNVMRPLLHREPGPVGAAFLYDVYLQFIADGVHTHPATIALVSRYLKDRLVLISDSVLAVGLGIQGEFDFDGQKVTVDETSVRLAGGRLAGSILTLDRAVRNVVSIGGLDLASAFRAAGQNPARSIGVTDRGIIRPGAVADIVILTPDLHVSSTICEGSVVYSA